MVSVRSDKLYFYALNGKMGEIGLLLAGKDRRTRQTRWDRQTGKTGWDKGGTERPTVVGARLGDPPLSLELQRVMGSGDCHHFHQ